LSKVWNEFQFYDMNEIIEQRRQFTYKRNILARSPNHFCRGNTTFSALSLIVDLHVGVKCSLLPWKCSIGVLFHCCRAAKYCSQQYERT